MREKATATTLDTRQPIRAGNTDETAEHPKIVGIDGELPHL
jgi:hypothetical protein